MCGFSIASTGVDVNFHWMGDRVGDWMVRMSMMNIMVGHRVRVMQLVVDRVGNMGKRNLVVGVEMHVRHVGVLLHIVVWHADSKHGLQTEGMAGHLGMGGHVVTRGVLVVRLVHLWWWMVG